MICHHWPDIFFTNISLCWRGKPSYPISHLLNTVFLPLTHCQWFLCKDTRVGWVMCVVFFFSLPCGILEEYGIQLLFEPQLKLAVWFPFQHNTSWILKLLKYAAVCAFLQVLEPLRKQSANLLNFKQNTCFFWRCFRVQVSWTGQGKSSLAWCWWRRWCCQWEQHSDTQKRGLGSSFILFCRNSATVWKKILIPFWVKMQWLRIHSRLLRASLLVLGGKSHLSQT